MIAVLCYVSIQIVYAGKNNSWQGQIVGTQIKEKEKGILVDFTSSLNTLGYTLRQPKVFTVNDNDCVYLDKYERYKYTFGPSVLEQAISLLK